MDKFNFSDVDLIVNIPACFPGVKLTQKELTTPSKAFFSSICKQFLINIGVSMEVPSFFMYENSEMRENFMIYARMKCVLEKIHNVPFTFLDFLEPKPKKVRLIIETLLNYMLFAKGVYAINDEIVNETREVEKLSKEINSMKTKLNKNAISMAEDQFESEKIEVELTAIRENIQKAKEFANEVDETDEKEKKIDLHYNDKIRKLKDDCMKLQNERKTLDDKIVQSPTNILRALEQEKEKETEQIAIINNEAATKKSILSQKAIIDKMDITSDMPVIEELIKYKENRLTNEIVMEDYNFKIKYLEDECAAIQSKVANIISEYNQEQNSLYTLEEKLKEQKSLEEEIARDICSKQGKINSLEEEISQMEGICIQLEKETLSELEKLQKENDKLVFEELKRREETKADLKNFVHKMINEFKE